jgi:hypothetical protein
MRCRWRRSRPQPTATSSRSPADAAAAGTAALMAAAAATTPGHGCTPARAVGTPAPSAAAALTGPDAGSATFCSDPRVLPDRSAAKKILEFNPSTAVERARGIQSRKAYCNYMRMSGGPKGPPFLLTSEQSLTVVPAFAATTERLLDSIFKQPVGWVERSDTHQCPRRRRWISLRSTHPTLDGSGQHVTSNAPPAACHIGAPARTTASQAPGRRCRRAQTAAHRHPARASHRATRR